MFNLGLIQDLENFQRSRMKIWPMKLQLNETSDHSKSSKGWQIRQIS